VTRVAVLGGSAVSTPQLAAALDAAGVRGIELALAGRSAAKLALVAAATRTAGGGRVEVTEHTDVAPAVEGAEIVLSQVRVGGLDGRAFDESFSRDLGIPGEETVGPGGFSSAWRTLPIVRALAREVFSASPGALVLNLTNPASMVHRVTEEVGLRVVTLCDAPLVLARKLAAVIGEEARPRYAGMNHCGWITGLEAGGRDVLDEAVAHAPEVERLTGVDAGVVTRLRLVPNPYLRYLYHPDRQLAAQLEQEAPRARELAALEREALEDYADGAGPAAAARRRPAPWYSECVVPLVRSVVDDVPVRTIVDVRNQDLLPYLPPSTTVEVAADVRGGDVVPLPPDPLPDDARAILEQVAAYDELAVDAILAADRPGCVRALATHPLVPSTDVAAELVDRIEGRFGALAA
jgi:6-phospho-beta-glucosidase